MNEPRRSLALREAETDEAGCYYKGVDVTLPHRSIVFAAVIAGCILLATAFGIAWIGDQDPTAGYVPVDISSLSGTGGIDVSIVEMLQKADAKILMRPDKQGGRIILSEPVRISGRIRSLSGAFTAPPLFLFETGDLSSLSGLAVLLHQADPAFAEGLSGIVRAFLLDLTGSSNLESAVDELGAGPVSIAITEDGYAAAGTAASNGDLDVWLGRVKGQETGAAKRTLQFISGESTWTDIAAGSGAGSHAVARSGRQFMLATSEALLASVMQAQQTAVNSEQAISGSFNVNWTVEKLRSFFPLLSATLKAADTTGLARLKWHGRQGQGGLIIDWILAN